MQFSSPELVWVGMAENDTTVGALKEANQLDCRYSAELEKDQSDEINAQSVGAGDWALIGVQPYESEENLTITMKNGDRFEIKVTDAQISTRVITSDGEDYLITVSYGSEAGIPDGVRLEATEIPKDSALYEQYLNATEDILGQSNGIDVKVNFARFFDITFKSCSRDLNSRGCGTSGVLSASRRLEQL